MTNVELLESMIAGWLEQLADDAASEVGRPDYSIGGQTVSRAQWRDSLLKNVEQINKLIQQLEPFEFKTQVIN